MYYGQININKVLSKKAKLNNVTESNNVIESDEDVRENWLNEICDRYTPVSLFESKISSKLDDMIDSIPTNPLNIVEYNKFITNLRIEGTKLSASSMRKILKFNTELILNPEVKLDDRQLLANIVNLPVMLAKQIMNSGQGDTSATVYKTILESYKISEDRLKNINQDKLEILNSFNNSIKETVSLLSEVNIKESFNSVGEAYDNTISGTYLEKMFQFEYQTVDMFTNDEDITLEQFQDYMRLALTLENLENVMEANHITNTSRKVVNKFKTGVRHLDQKTSGKRETVSKNVKRIDKTLSDIVNKKYDDIVNISRDNKREKLITGKTSIKLGKLLKNTVLTLVGKTAAGVMLGPIGGTIATIAGVLGAYACSKRTEVREKKRILLELETEHKIITEKIEDARGENDRKQKYELMRAQAKIEKEITRIKYNMRYY